MGDKKTAKQTYKMQPKEAGIFLVRNTVTGRVLLGSSTNLHGPFNRISFELKLGSLRNARLQEDWKTYGAEAFAFEIVEKLRLSDDPGHDYSRELTVLEQALIERFRPLEDKTYNQNERIRI